MSGVNGGVTSAVTSIIGGVGRCTLKSFKVGVGPEIVTAVRGSLLTIGITVDVNLAVFFSLQT